MVNNNSNVRWSDVTRHCLTFRVGTGHRTDEPLVFSRLFSHTTPLRFGRLVFFYHVRGTTNHKIRTNLFVMLGPVAPRSRTNRPNDQWRSLVMESSLHRNLFNCALKSDKPLKILNKLEVVNIADESLQNVETPCK
jgi:hypothetical protein